MNLISTVLGLMIMSFGRFEGEASDPSTTPWGYHKGRNFNSPDIWKDIPGTACGGKRQSPVNIDKSKLVYRNDLRPVTVSKRISNEIVSLNTHPTSLYLTFSDNWLITFGGEGCYKPMAIHWHWGLKNNQGSEHTINGVQYDMEGHIVTYDCKKYNSSDDAVKSNNGLYVFGMLYKVGYMNSALGKLIPFMDTVLSNGKVSISEMSPVQFFPQDHASYYRYNGSLTTPPCTENVVWTVFHDIQTISEYQLFKFRSLQFGTPESGSMGDNFRLVQPLIDRIVFTSFNDSPICSFSFCIISLSIMFSLLSSLV